MVGLVFSSLDRSWRIFESGERFAEVRRMEKKSGEEER